MIKKKPSRCNDMKFFVRKPIVAGNWKMNKTSFEAIELITLLKRELSDCNDVEIVVCPPLTALSEVHDVLNESNIGLGAQNLYWEEFGAFTGEVSAPMLREVGVKYVIIGHSERRQFFSETNENVNKKIRNALKWKLKPIVCIGENLEEREENKTFDVIKKQLQKSLSEFTKED